MVYQKQFVLQVAEFALEFQNFSHIEAAGIENEKQRSSWGALVQKFSIKTQQKTDQHRSIELIKSILAY